MHKHDGLGYFYDTIKIRCMLVPPFRCMCLNPIYVARYVRNIYIYIINEFVNFKSNLTTYRVRINTTEQRDGLILRNSTASLHRQLRGSA